MPKTYRRKRYPRGLRGLLPQVTPVIMTRGGALRNGGHKISLPDPPPVTGCWIRKPDNYPVVPHAHKVTRIDWIRFKLGAGPEPGSREWRKEQHNLAAEAS